MKSTTLNDIICPKCMSEESAESSLALSSFVPQRFADREDNREIIESILVCDRCRNEYPILAGVLIAVPDVATYIRTQFGALISICTQHGGISPALLDYMVDRGYNLAKTECREYYDSPRKLSTYICGHYDNIAQVATDGNPFSTFLQVDYKDFYSSVLELWDQKRAQVSERRLALDVGTYVGGVVDKVADLFDRVYGIDLSFAGVLTSRAIQIGSPLRKTDYDLYIQGNIRQRRKIPATFHDNVDFLVASALSLPFRPSYFSFVTNLNLMELVSSPRLMLCEIGRVVKLGGNVIIASPYWWEEDECSIGEWIGGQYDQRTEHSLRSVLKEQGIDLIAEQTELPWILRYNARTFMTFICDVVIGEITGKTESDEMRSRTVNVSISPDK